MKERDKSFEKYGFHKRGNTADNVRLWIISTDNDSAEDSSDKEITAVVLQGSDLESTAETYIDISTQEECTPTVKMTKNDGKVGTRKNSFKRRKSHYCETSSSDGDTNR